MSQSSVNHSLLSYPPELFHLQVCSVCHSSPLSFPSLNHYLYTIVVLEAAVCHSVILVCSNSLLANVHCNESLVWFKAFGFCCITNPGPPLRLLSAILLLPSHGDPVLTVSLSLSGHTTQVSSPLSIPSWPTLMCPLGQLAPHPSHHWYYLVAASEEQGQLSQVHAIPVVLCGCC